MQDALALHSVFHVVEQASLQAFSSPPPSPPSSTAPSHSLATPIARLSHTVCSIADMLLDILHPSPLPSLPPSLPPSERSSLERRHRHRHQLQEQVFVSLQRRIQKAMSMSPCSLVLPGLLHLLLLLLRAWPLHFRRLVVEGPDSIPSVLLQKALEKDDREGGKEGGKEGGLESKPWLTAAILLWDLLAQPASSLATPPWY
ncbi:hypothetical protein Naga_101967g1 [Nannochloropsis gaditana]|uniref:Uncharacterized protein n=1 Tax=Nannochloropsis gaditana TaxID=72520 RepID=W7U4Y7_9STRA|nr:hypothetical protein Naga_101967g1 [Nannochloropsis gaditana]